MKQFLKSKAITIETTTFCTAKCIVCPRDKYRFSFQHMNFELYKKVIDQAVAAGAKNIDTCGFGDFYADPGYEDKLIYLKENYPDVQVYVGTTGCLLDKNKLEATIKYVDTLKFSMYSIDENIYKSIHGQHMNYNQVMENIENVLKYPAGQRPYVILYAVLVDSNKNNYQKWLDYWQPKADEVMIWNPHNWTGYYGLPCNHTSNNGLKSCGRPQNANLVIHSDGAVSPCCFDFNKQMIVGNINDQTLEEIYFGEKMQKIRAIHESGDFMNSGLICWECDQLNDRSDALVYSSNKQRKVGVINSSPINDLNDIVG